MPTPEQERELMRIMGVPNNDPLLKELKKALSVDKDAQAQVNATDLLDNLSESIIHKNYEGVIEARSEIFDALETLRALQDGMKTAVELFCQIDQDITYESEEAAKVGRFGLPHTTCMAILAFIEKWNTSLP